MHLIQHVSVLFTCTLGVFFRIVAKNRFPAFIPHIFCPIWVSPFPLHRYSSSSSPNCFPLPAPTESLHPLHPQPKPPPYAPTTLYTILISCGYWYWCGESRSLHSWGHWLNGVIIVKKSIRCFATLLGSLIKWCYNNEEVYKVFCNVVLSTCFCPRIWVWLMILTCLHDSLSLVYLYGC